MCAMFQNEENGEREYEMGMEAETVIGASVKLDGDFHSESDTVVHGHVSGKVVVRGDITLGSTSVVKANVEGVSVIIAGNVLGNVIAQEKLTLLATARVEGDIEAGTLEILEGATLNGHCSMGAENTAVDENVAEETHEDES